MEGNAPALSPSKTLVAASDAPVPPSYAAALRTLGQLGLVPRELADRLAALAELRDALAHEYLDLKWPLVKEFIDEGCHDVLELVALVERIIMPSLPEASGPGPTAGVTP